MVVSKKRFVAHQAVIANYHHTASFRKGYQNQLKYHCALALIDQLTLVSFSKRGSAEDEINITCILK